MNVYWMNVWRGVVPLAATVVFTMNRAQYSRLAIKSLSFSNISPVKATVFVLITSAATASSFLRAIQIRPNGNKMVGEHDVLDGDGDTITIWGTPGGCITGSIEGGYEK